MTRPRFFLLAPLAGLFVWAVGAHAAGLPGADWSLCPPLEANPQVPRQEDGVTTLSADQATAEGEERSVFSGNVVIDRDGRRLEAQQAIYDKKNDTVDVNGNVSFFSNSIAFVGESAHLNLGDESGRIDAVRYRISSAHAFGTAERAEFRSAQVSEFKGATYTTCPPGHEAWLLSAQRLLLDRDSNTGEAYNVTLDLGSVPVLYLPYMTFPLSGRKSGLLFPMQGTSQRNGTDITVPWYWNIAPDRDATLAPRLISARGNMVMSEFRYLNPDNAGELSVDLLPDDQLYGDSRSYLRYHHAQRFGSRWNADLDYREVSDPDYLNDLENTLANSSTRYLERRLDLNYRGDGWSFLGRAQDFQPLQTGVTEYQRMPQLLASGGARAGRVRYDYRAEYVNFENEDAQRPVGSRVDLYPGASLPFTGDAWFITPRLAARHTQYDLTDATAGKTTPSRTLPIASLDSGVVFERDLELFRTPLVQTLEPRLYYLYVPERAQEALPTFDTEASTFSFEQLFRENRFTGPDRVGDANQVTAALTTRFLRGDNGAEAARASIGQIYYFTEPVVTLPGAAAETRHNSDIAGELAAYPYPAVEVSAATRWNPEIRNAEESAARVRYRPDGRHLIDFAWRYREEGKEMNRDLLVIWPLTPRWRFISRWYYDLVAERTLENVVGLEYQNCCWGARVVTRDKPFVNASGELQSDRSIYFTLELKGLANLGHSLESVIDEGMVGL